MVVKPITFVVVASLLALGAATGAYLAVRENRAPVSSGEMQADSSAIRSADANDPGTPVNVTEEVILSQADTENEQEPMDPSGSEPSVGAETEQPVPGRSRGQVEATVARRGPAPPQAPAPRPTPAQPPVERAARPASQSGPPPVVEGWELSEPWPNGASDTDLDTSTERPDEIALRTIEPSTLGVGLVPEARPQILEELVIPADSVIGLQVDTPISTEDAEVEDDVEARVTRDVLVGDRIAIPAGARMLGSVVLVERVGQLKGAARLGVRFHTVVLDDFVEVPVVTETVYRHGKGRGGESAAKIGGAAVGGAILGAIFGGRQGAAIGGAVGAAGGTAAAMRGDGQPATLPAGTTLTVRLSRPSTVSVEY